MIEHVELPADGRSWQLAYAASSDVARVHEYVPHGDQLDTWTELITVQSAMGTAARPLDARPDAVVEEIANRLVDGGVELTVLDDDADDILYSWRVSDDIAIVDELAVTRELITARGTHILLKYASRVAQDWDASCMEWASRLRACVVTPTAPIVEITPEHIHNVRPLPPSQRARVLADVDRVLTPDTPVDDQIAMVSMAADLFARTLEPEHWAIMHYQLGSLFYTRLAIEQHRLLSTSVPQPATNAAVTDDEWLRVATPTGDTLVFEQHNVDDATWTSTITAAQRAVRLAIEATVPALPAMTALTYATLAQLVLAQRSSPTIREIRAAAALAERALLAAPRSPTPVGSAVADALEALGRAHIWLLGQGVEDSLRDGVAALATLIDHHDRKADEVGLLCAQLRLVDLYSVALSRCPSNDVRDALFAVANEVGGALERAAGDGHIDPLAATRQLERLNRTMFIAADTAGGSYRWAKWVEDDVIRARRPALYLRPLTSAGSFLLPNAFRNTERLAIQFDHRPEELTLEAAIVVAVAAQFVFTSVGGVVDPLMQRRIVTLTGSELWRDVVEAELAGSSLVLIVPDGTSGLEWEIQQLVRHGCLDRTVFVMLPGDTGVDRDRRWADAQVVAGIAGVALPNHRPDGGFVRLTADGKRVQTLWDFNDLWNGALADGLSEIADRQTAG